MIPEKLNRDTLYNHLRKLQDEGKNIPNIKELAKHFDINPQVLGRKLRKLAEEGRIVVTTETYTKITIKNIV